MSFPRYERYKDSGVEWLGEVPEGWEICSLKRVAYLKSGDMITSEQINESGEFPVLGGNGLRGFTDKYTHSGHYALIGRQGALCGNINYATGKFWASEHAVVATPIKKVSTYWLGEMLRAMNLNQYSVSAAQPGLSVEILSNLRIPFPDYDEQIAIGSFLHGEASKIDSLIAEQKKLIELLKEKRQALISHAVTKGLNPQVKMKDSGVEWLGEVPEGWDIKKLKFLGESIIGLTYSPEDIVDEGDGCLVLRSSNIQDGKLSLLDNVFVGSEIPDRLRTRVGDILICARNGSRALIGKNCLIGDGAENVTFGAFMTVFRTVYSGYIHCVLNSFLFEYQSGRFLTSTINQLTTGTLNEFEIPFPPADEQGYIVNFLKLETAKIDTLVSEAQKAITLLQERRSALISAAVTGKIDVRSTQANYGGI